jgi:hemoglobin
LTVEFYERVLADELLRPLFGDMAADHPRHVADFIGEVMGGEADYTSTRGRTRDHAAAPLREKHI